MGKVFWMQRETGHAAITVVSASPVPQVFVALGARHWNVTAAVHYVPHLQRSLPHEADDCQWCRFPATVKTWLPCQKCPAAFARSIMSEPRLAVVPARLPEYSTWVPKVVEITPSAAALLGRIEAGCVFALVRGEGRFHKKVLWHIFDQNLGNTLPPFDVRPHLEKSWGREVQPDNFEK